MLGDPSIVFLDEPTIGLDPVSAQEVRGFVRELSDAGKTVVLTTHYMAEADQLCEQLAIVLSGRIIASGTPAEIRGEFSETTVLELSLSYAAQDVVQRVETIAGVGRAEIIPDRALQKLHVQVSADFGDMALVENAVGREYIEDSVSRRPTLEEAYLSIVTKAAVS